MNWLAVVLIVDVLAMTLRVYAENSESEMRALGWRRYPFEFCYGAVVGGFIEAVFFDELRSILIAGFVSGIVFIISIAVFDLLTAARDDTINTIVGS